LMQMIRDLKRQESRLVSLDPNELSHRQDHFDSDVKLTFDARRITKQMEVMIIFLQKGHLGQAGVDRCQQTVHIRTSAVWPGKDSKENVLRSLQWPAGDPDFVTSKPVLARHTLSTCISLVMD
jgi:hypothetical protein